MFGTASITFLSMIFSHPGMPYDVSGNSGNLLYSRKFTEQHLDKLRQRIIEEKQQRHRR